MKCHVDIFDVEKLKWSRAYFEKFIKILLFEQTIHEQKFIPDPILTIYVLNFKY